MHVAFVTHQEILFVALHRLCHLWVHLCDFIVYQRQMCPHNLCCYVKTFIAISVVLCEGFVWSDSLDYSVGSAKRGDFTSVFFQYATSGISSAMKFLHMFNCRQTWAPVPWIRWVMHRLRIPFKFQFNSFINLCDLQSAIGRLFKWCLLEERSWLFYSFSRWSTLRFLHL